MADWSKPTLTSTYSNYLSETTGRDVDCATQFSVGTPTNIPTGAIRWNTSLFRWQVWSGTAWGELATTYALTGISCTSLNNTGNTTLGDSSADTVTSNAANWTFANATTVSGALTWSGSQTFNGNVSLNGAVTVGDASADTVTVNAANWTFANTTTVGGALTWSGSQTFNGAVSGNTSIWNIGSGQFYKDASGNIAIGNTSPGAKLDVAGNIRLSATNPNIEFNDGGGMIYGPAGNTLAFATGGGPGSPVERFRITSTGGITSSNLADAVGYKGIPVSGGAPKTANYTLLLTDMGTDVQFNATTLTCTIPANAGTAFPIGTTIVVSNLFAGNLTLAITTDSLFIAGTTTGGAGVSRTIAQNGQVTLIKKTSTMWWAVGAGLS